LFFGIAVTTRGGASLFTAPPQIDFALHASLEIPVRQGLREILIRKSGGARTA
jgi:hypothetical protein